jgi:2-isopropylmalate synthase
MPKNSTSQISIFDTTLRDGEQGEGVSFTVGDKLKIARLLDELGVDYIEGGWPASNPKAIDFFKEVKKEKLKHAKMVAFGSTMHPKNSKAADDANLQALVEVGTPTICIFGKSWDIHAKEALGISLEKNLELIADSVKFLKNPAPSKKREVIFDAEHFFDGYKSNPEYALKVLQTAKEAGADCVVLCDTNGGTLPSEIQEIVSHVRQFLKGPIGIHCHNDSELAVANTVAAVTHGVTHVQGTINGMGERCGNANLCSIIPNLQIKLGYKVITPMQLKKMTEISHHIYEIANLHHQNNQAYVGKSAFAHKGGIHVSAVAKNSKLYEHIAPDLVGNKQRVLVSEQSGVSNLLYKAAQAGVDLKKDDPQTKSLLQKIKTMEHAGYQFEEGEASFQILLKKYMGKHKPLFKSTDFRVISEKQEGQSVRIEATLHVEIGGEQIHIAADGNGPVSALDNALRKALIKHYPSIQKLNLVDYKVRVLDGGSGTGSKVRVLIETTDSKKIWGTVGVSANIIEASWDALIDSYEYYLLNS